MTPEEIAEHRLRRYNGTIVYKKMVHSDLMIFRVKTDFPRPNYSAGQYCALGLGYWEPRAEGCQDEELQPEMLSKLVRRSYSISNSVLTEQGELRDMDQDDWVEFYVVLVRENLDGRVPALTPRLFKLDVGDRLNIGEKFVGHFTAEPVQPNDTVIFLSTGTGEAPHNSMLWELLRRGHQGKILAACCVRQAADLGYADIHKELMERYSNYKYLGLTTREPGIPKRYIQDLITEGELEDHLQAKLEPANTHIFLCGNPLMIGIPTKDKLTGDKIYPQPTGVIEILEQLGFQADDPASKTHGNIHFEKYW